MCGYVCPLLPLPGQIWVCEWRWGHPGEAEEGEGPWAAFGHASSAPCESLEERRGWKNKTAFNKQPSAKVTKVTIHPTHCTHIEHPLQIHWCVHRMRADLVGLRAVGLNWFPAKAHRHTGQPTHYHHHRGCPRHSTCLPLPVPLRESTCRVCARVIARSYWADLARAMPWRSSPFGTGPAGGGA